jgi:hypothetical protein
MYLLFALAFAYYVHSNIVHERIHSRVAGYAQIYAVPVFLRYE